MNKNSSSKRISINCGYHIPSICKHALLRSDTIHIALQRVIFGICSIVQLLLMLFHHYTGCGIESQKIESLYFVIFRLHIPMKVQFDLFISISYLIWSCLNRKFGNFMLIQQQILNIADFKNMHIIGPFLEIQNCKDQKQFV